MCIRLCNGTELKVGHIIEETLNSSLAASPIYDDMIEDLATDFQTRSNLTSCFENFNLTQFGNFLTKLVQNHTLLSEERRKEIEGDPLVYIIAVLFFYSCGIVVLMINYMKKVTIYIYITKEVISDTSRSLTAV